MSRRARSPLTSIHRRHRLPSLSPAHSTPAPFPRSFRPSRHLSRSTSLRLSHEHCARDQTPRPAAA
eukprot:1696263-Pleurochrysis_carterae.AAC.2